ncbi:hypothetical protein BC830DRAFT_1128254 [Chytriomyces sp. MP71]|nr:hypothetical protein BC830DRAFT_1128254 [Chytriomyces sp. MP71]
MAGSKKASATSYRSLSSLLSAFLAGLVLSGIIFYITIMILVIQSATILPNDKKQIILSSSAIFVVMVVVKVLQVSYDLYRRYVVKGNELGDETSTVAAGAA